MKIYGTWREIADAARTTIGMKEGVKEPTDRWKKNMLLAEHSPIRLLKINHVMEGIKYWVSTHFVRHKFGVEHFISTQRTDRTGANRDEIVQSALVNHRIEANAQSIINISRKRLCQQASTETRVEWVKVVKSLKDVDPILASVCVPECIYRGFCPEMKPCGYSETKQYEDRLKEYRNVK